MMKKIIAAVIGTVLLANAGMITSAEESNVENSVGTETQATVSEETTTEASSPAEVGAAIRKKLNVKVCDVIYKDDKAYLYDVEGNIRRAGSGWNMWIIGVDDENQRFRVDVPKMREEGNSVFYLLYADAEDAIGVSHKGYVVGDLDYDQRVDVFDLCLMKRYFIYGWDSPLKKVLADMNDDNQVTVADLVWLQKWLLGEIK